MSTVHHLVYRGWVSKRSEGCDDRNSKTIGKLCMCQIKNVPWVDWARVLILLVPAITVHQSPRSLNRFLSKTGEVRAWFEFWTHGRSIDAEAANIGQRENEMEWIGLNLYFSIRAELRFDKFLRILNFSSFGNWASSVVYMYVGRSIHERSTPAWFPDDKRSPRNRMCE